MLKRALFPLMLVAASAPTVASSTASGGDEWPNRPVRWVVGFAPGGTADTISRIAAEQLSEKIGQPVVIENRPGASGSIALNLVAKASPDDTLLITVPGPILFPRPEPSIGQELAPIILLAQGPMMLVGPKGNPQRSLKEVIADAKAQPGKWNYATSGTGTSQHLAGELLKQRAGISMQQVPYKGGGQAVSDVVGGQVPLAILGPTPVLPHIKSGALQAYAVTTTYRLPSMPDVPTVQEEGVNGYDASQYFALATTSGVPEERIERLNAYLQDIVRTETFQTAVETAGMKIDPGPASEVVEFITNDDKKWRDLVAETGLEIGQ